MIDKDKLLEDLEEKGLRVVYDEDWVGEPGIDRHPVPNKNKIRHVTFPLSPVDWCSLCMNEGEHYVGGCCGNTSHIQDYYNSIFRDGGGADAETILELMDAAGTHEGFEETQHKFNVKKIPALINKWNELRPVQKIGIVCQLVKDKLHLNGLGMPWVVKKPEPDDYCRLLEHSLGLLSWRDITVREEDEDKKTGQDHANRELLLARMLPAAMKVIGVSIPYLAKPFSGFAIVKKGSKEIESNRLGYCIYNTKEDAQAIIDLWKKSEAESKREDDKEMAKHLASLEIRPVKVTAADGIVWV